MIPDITIEQMSDFFTKYHLNTSGKIPWPINAVVHHFTAPDSGDPHDHPWGFTSHILQGSYVEEVYVPHPSGGWTMEKVTRKAGTAHYVSAQHIHRITSLPEGECWTLILPGHPEQKSGFWRFTGEGIFYRPWDSPEFQLLFKA